MNVRGAAYGVLWWLASCCLAGTVPDPGDTDSRIRVASYVPDAVYRLRG
jgi:hypothetical protein